jgi:hypothetical protein
MGVSAAKSLVEPYMLMNNLLRDRRARREDNVEVGNVLLDGDKSSDEDDDIEEMLPRRFDVIEGEYGE